jgi:diacylglycerol kinase family enzyme
MLLSSVGRMLNAGAAGAALVAAGMAIYVRYKETRWREKIAEFHREHHGYKTTFETSGTKNDVLLIVNPASGAGKAMKMFEQVLRELEAKKQSVEVYVTESANDMITLADQKDLSVYTKMIVVLAGDSSVFEMIQSPLRKNNGKWAYAPILHLPGGSSNILSAEFHHRSTNLSDIIDKSTIVRKGSVLQSTAEDGTTRFSLQVCATGIFQRLIETLERRRHDLYAAFGPLALPLVALYVFATFPLRPMTPPLFSCQNSDIEAEGMDLGYGVTKFTNTMSVLHVKEYKGLFDVIGHLAKNMKGEYGKQCQEGEPFPEGIDILVTKKYELEGGGPYRFISDGTSSMALEGRKITIEVVPDAIPYCVMPEKKDE